jgi:hypothetical protein
MSKRFKSLTVPELLEFFIGFYGRHKDEVPKTRKFKPAEIAMLEEIIFGEKYTSLPFYVADYVSNCHMDGIEIANAPTIKRLKFLRYMLGGLNAKEAAIRAGYSKKSAKQQGYRTLKAIQRLVNEEK